jgi:hypothetical protein
MLVGRCLLYKNMKLNIITIVLDGEPYIERHLPVFQSLKLDWNWNIREGAAANTKCTRWCQRQKPRFSEDGTHEYLQKISLAGNVEYFGQTWWDGKVAMFNDVVYHIQEPCVLMEIDSDEIWTQTQLEKIVQLFEMNPTVNMMKFYCRYFVGPDIITMGEDCYGNNDYEWLRAWRFTPGMLFDSHEPPVLAGNKGNCFDRKFTKEQGLVFDHFAYATEAQVAYKEYFYRYPDAVKHWKRLQANTVWPVKLKTYLPWVDDRVTATRI